LLSPCLGLYPLHECETRAVGDCVTAAPAPEDECGDSPALLSAFVDKCENRERQGSVATATGAVERRGSTGTAGEGREAAVLDMVTTGAAGLLGKNLFMEDGLRGGLDAREEPVRVIEGALPGIMIVGAAAAGTAVGGTAGKTLFRGKNPCGELGREMEDRVCPLLPLALVGVVIGVCARPEALAVMEDTEAGDMEAGMFEAVSSLSL